MVNTLIVTGGHLSLHYVVIVRRIQYRGQMEYGYSDWWWVWLVGVVTLGLFQWLVFFLICSAFEFFKSDDVIVAFEGFRVVR